jgi:cysteine-rich repeat protein
VKASGISWGMAAVLGGCRIDAPNAEGFLLETEGSGSSSTSMSPSGSSGGDGPADVDSGSGGSGSGDEGPSITSGPETTETTETTSDESSTGPSSVCGDEVVDRPEACDDGVNDGSYGGCTLDCLDFAPYCGDGVVNGPEGCDDGINDGTYDGCALDCSGPGPYCGNGIVDGLEACDDGINDGMYDGCVPGCVAFGPYCGDGSVDELEVCDDGINDGAYGGCAPSCLALAAHCGNGMVDGPESCDDGINDGAYGGCELGCIAFAGYCGDGIANGPEACDDGLNDGSYGNCSIDCLSPPTHCGDGLVNGPELCDDANSDSSDGCLTSCDVPDGCMVIRDFDAAASDGAYVIDPDGTGGIEPFQVYCNMALDGGGWQLISVRHEDSGVLFADAICTDIAASCSGTVRDEQLQAGASPDLLFATTSGVYWLRLTGLAPPGSNALMDVITLDRVLDDTDSCIGDHYCNANLDVGLMVFDSSPNYAPRFIALPSQYARLGGIWLGNGGGGGDDHVVSLNYGDYCSPSGLQLSDASDASLGNVTCSQPGALYFRY